MGFGRRDQPVQGLPADRTDHTLADCVHLRTARRRLQHPRASWKRPPPDIRAPAAGPSGERRGPRRCGYAPAQGRSQGLPAYTLASWADSSHSGHCRSRSLSDAGESDYRRGSARRRRNASRSVVSEISSRRADFRASPEEERPGREFVESTAWRTSHVPQHNEQCRRRTPERP